MRDARGELGNHAGWHSKWYIRTRWIMQVRNDKRIPKAGLDIAIDLIDEKYQKIGVSFMSPDTLAATSDHAERTVRRELAKLVRRGHLYCEKGGAAPGQTNRYRLRLTGETLMMFAPELKFPEPYGYLNDDVMSADAPGIAQACYGHAMGITGDGAVPPAGDGAVPQLRKKIITKASGLRPGTGAPSCAVPDTAPPDDLDRKRNQIFARVLSIDPTARSITAKAIEWSGVDTVLTEIELMGDNPYPGEFRAMLAHLTDISTWRPLT